MQSFEGCSIWFITLEGGMQIMTKNLQLRFDVASCSKFLQSSSMTPFMQVPPLDESPLYDSKAEGRVKLLEEFRKELFHGPRVRKFNRLGDIARPFASDMKLWNLGSLANSINMPPSKSHSFWLRRFLVSTVLHMLFMFVYHNYHLAERLFPNVIKADHQKIFVNELLMFPKNTSQPYQLLEKAWDIAFGFVNLLVLLFQRTLTTLWNNQS